MPKRYPEKGKIRPPKVAARCDSQNEKKPFHKSESCATMGSGRFPRQGVLRMLKSKKLSVLQVLLCALAVVLCPLALVSCPGNGEAAGSNDDDTYTPRGRINGGGY